MRTSAREWLWLARIHLRHGVMELPPPGSTWFSALRRAAVVAAFFAVGLATDTLHLTVMGAFGALQVGLMEAARPGRQLAGLLSVNVVAIALSAFVASALGGTWWVLPLIVGLGYVYGCVSSLGLGALSVSLGALAIAVIFAGLPQSPGTAAVGALWVAIGGTVQAVVWLLDLRHDRSKYVRRILAVKVESMASIARGGVVNRRVVNRSFSATDRARATLNSAGLSAARKVEFEDLLAAQLQTLRALLTWMVLREPGLSPRMHVALRMEAIAKSMKAGRPVPASWTSQPVPLAPDDEPPWLATQALSDKLDQLALTATAVAAVPLDDSAAPTERSPTGRRAVEADIAIIAGPQAPPPERGWKAVRAALRPASPSGKYGLRMALALAIAEAITLLVSVGHSFWLPLTVVFILRPDVVNTLFRGLTRLAGNFAAVIVVPTVFAVATGHDPALVLVVLLLAAVTYRYFTGNYALTSFGLAGTVLVLDTTLAPGPDLFFMRIAATAAGALLALLVVVAVPVMPRKNAGAIIAGVAATFGAWTAQVTAGLSGAGATDRSALARSLADSRAQLQSLGSAAESALFEPRMRTQGVRLTVALDAAWRMEIALVALSFYTRVLSAAQASDADHGATMGADESHAVEEQQQRLAAGARDLAAELDGRWKASSV